MLQIVYFLFNMPVVYRPHPLFSMHVQAQCWKGSSGYKTAMPQSVAVLRYSGYRARGVCALQSSSSQQFYLLFCRSQSMSITISVFNLLIDVLAILSLYIGIVSIP